MRVIEAIYESVRSGRAVRLPSFTKKRRPRLAQEIYRAPHGKPETIDVESPSGEAA